MSKMKWRLAVAMLMLSACSRSGEAAITQTTAADEDGSLHVSFTANEGSWMSASVSADGKLVYFDLLGRLYRVPIEGGTAEPLADPGEDWEFCPSLSPDGRELAFLSTRGGYTDVWVETLATGERRKVTGGDEWHDGPVYDQYRLSCAPIWTADGGSLVVTRSFRTSGSADGSRGFYVVSTNGREMRRATFTNPEGVKRPHLSDALPFEGDYLLSIIGRPHRQIVRRKGPKNTEIFAGKGLSSAHRFAPALSRTGDKLAFLRSSADESVALWIQDLQTGEMRELLRLPELDGYVHATELPGYGFTPDGKQIVIGYGGKLHRVDVATGQAMAIEFSAVVDRRVHPRLEARYHIEDGDVQLKAQRWPAVSPDRKRLAFSAAGDVWLRDLDSEKVERISSGEGIAMMPAWSPDGAQLAYVQMPLDGARDAVAGDLVVLDLATRERRQWSAGKAAYRVPRWSPNGSRIAVMKLESGQPDAAIGWLDRETGVFNAAVHVPTANFEYRASLPLRLDWSGDGQKLRFQSPEPFWEAVSAKPGTPTTALEEVSVDGSGRRVIARAGVDVHAIVPSPDLRWALLIGWDLNAYIVPLPKPGQSADAPLLSIAAAESKRISANGALYPQWLSETRLTYGWLDQIFEYAIGTERSTELAHTRLELPRHQGSGLVAYRNARILPMGAHPEAAGKVIEQGTLLVDGPRIRAVGAEGEVQVPQQAQVIDASGMTIVPGLVDTHLHYQMDDLVDAPPARLGHATLLLASGYTTAFDPGGGSLDDEALDLRAMVETGRVRGPRLMFDDVMDDVYFRPKDLRESEAQLRQRFQRKRDLGIGPCLKELNPHDYERSRRQAQMARALGFCYVAHVEDYPVHQLAAIAQGYALHHEFWLAPSYGDVIEFMRQAGASWTPHSGLAWDINQVEEPQPYSLHADIFDRLEAIQDAGDRQRFERTFAARWNGEEYFEAWRRHHPEPKVPLLRQVTTDVVRNAIDAGVLVTLSEHGLGGIAGHELATWENAGIAREDILWAATMGSAKQLGIHSQIGSLEPGKLADFLVLKADPRGDILNLRRMKWVVVNGYRHDADALDITELRLR